MNQITTKELLIKIFTPTLLLSIAYLLLGNFGKLPHILLFCILATIILVPVELGMIMSASKKEYGTWSLKSAFAGQEKMLIWKVILIAGVFFGVAGLLSAVVAPIENHMWVNVRTTVLSHLPIGFDWNNYEYLQSFSSVRRRITIGCKSKLNFRLTPIRPRGLACNCTFLSA